MEILLFDSNLEKNELIQIVDKLANLMRGNASSKFRVAHIKQESTFDLSNDIEVDKMCNSFIKTIEEAQKNHTDILLVSGGIIESLHRSKAQQSQQSCYSKEFNRLGFEFSLVHNIMKLNDRINEIPFVNVHSIFLLGGNGNFETFYEYLLLLNGILDRLNAFSILNVGHQVIVKENGNYHSVTITEKDVYDFLLENIGCGIIYYHTFQPVTPKKNCQISFYEISQFIAKQKKDEIERNEILERCRTNKIVDWSEMGEKGDLFDYMVNSLNWSR